MSRAKSTTTVGELAILAASCGLVANTDDGRKAFCAWYANDQKAARKALFSRVAARRVAASAKAAATAGTGSASAGQQYPAAWAHRARVAAASGRRGKGVRITEAN